MLSQLACLPCESSSSCFLSHPSRFFFAWPAGRVVHFVDLKEPSWLRRGCRGKKWSKHLLYAKEQWCKVNVFAYVLAPPAPVRKKRSWSISSLLAKYQENVFTSVKMTMKYAAGKNKKKRQNTWPLFLRWVCKKTTTKKNTLNLLCKDKRHIALVIHVEGDEVNILFFYNLFLRRCRAGGDQVSSQPHAVHRHQEMHSFQQALQWCSGLWGRLRRGRSLSR